MKSIRLLETNFNKAEIIYSVFQDCAVFAVIKDGKLIPVYDFSGNNLRSTTNSLRKLFPDDMIKFYFRCSFDSRQTLPTPFGLSVGNCYLYF